MPILRPSDVAPAKLGPVPTLGGDISTNTPSTPTATTPTTQQQSSIATIQALQQAIFMPPAPTPTPAVNPDSGMLTAPWIVWFQTLNRRLGGYSSDVRSIKLVAVNTTGDNTALTDYIYICTAPLTFTMPTALSNLNRYTVVNASSGNVTLVPSGTQTINGQTSLTLIPNVSLDLISDLTNWRII